MFEVIEIDGKFFPVYNKEEWDKAVMEDVIENEKKLARIDGHEEGRKSGIKEGIKEGKIEGKKEGKKEGINLIAKKLKKENYPIKKL